MRVAVTGSKGQLGWELCRQLGEQAIPLDRAELDLADLASIRGAIRRIKPDAVINAGAYTAVDQAETEPELCRRINAEAVGELAEACREIDCALLQVSTDYVFGGTYSRLEPHREDEPVEPQGVYARTKQEGEVRAAGAPKHFVARTCGLYGRPSPGRSPANFVETMLRLGRERDHLRIVSDQTCTPSAVTEVAQAIVFLLGTEAYGTYHVTNTGSVAWIDFAAEIFRLAGLSPRLEAITTAQYGAPAPRPSYSVLDTSKYQRLGGPILSDWQGALARYLATRG